MSGSAAMDVRKALALSVLFIGAMSACNSKNSNKGAAASGTILSVRNLAGTNVVGLDTLVDAPSNSIVVAALQSGPADYGRGTIGATGSTVLVLVRYDAALQPLWQTVVDGDFGNSSPHIAFDPSGNVVLTVSGFSNVDLGHGPVGAPLVAEFSIADGSLRWSASLARQPMPDPRYVVSDPVSGDVFVVSNVTGTPQQAFVDRLAAASGAPLQSRPVGQSSGNMGVDSVAIDSDGNLLIAGTFDGQLRLQSNQFTAVPNQAWGYVTKIGKDALAALWARPLRMRDASQHVQISTLVGNDIAIAGQFAFADNATDNSNPLGPLAYLRLGRLSGATGNTSWSTRTELQNTAQLTFADLADFTDDIYLTMTFNGNLSIGGTTAVSTTSSAMAILHASGSDGKPVWLRYSLTSPTLAGRVGLGPDGNPMTAGSFTTTNASGATVQSIYIIEIVN